LETIFGKRPFDKEEDAIALNSTPTEA